MKGMISKGWVRQKCLEKQDALKASTANMLYSTQGCELMQLDWTTMRAL
jgi:hypothetical protein